MAAIRHILHLDMDAFFASVEQRDHPELRGKPVLVGHDGPRGVVAAASYEARVFGCRSAQPIAVAKRLCPHAVIVPGRHSDYRAASQQVFAELERITPLVEPVSIDEAFLDVTGVLRLHGAPREIAAYLKRTIKHKTALTASVGIAPNKFLAKLASDLQKPDGLTEITPENLDEVLLPLPVSRIWGIGPKTADRLASDGIHTIADLRRMGLEFLRARYGDSGADYWALAHGRDERAVQPDSEAKSIGHEETFETDLADKDRLRTILLEQTEAVAARLRKHDLQARRVTVKIRYGDFETITRAHTFSPATNRTDLLYEQARSIFDQWARSSFSPVRLIGVTAGQLGPPDTQLELFGNQENAKAQQVDAAVDAINKKFGNIVKRAGS